MQDGNSFICSGDPMHSFPLIFSQSYQFIQAYQFPISNNLIYFKGIMLGRAAGRVLFYLFIGNFVAITHQRKSQIWLQVEEGNRKKKLRIHYVWRPSRTYYLNMGDVRFFFLKMWRIFPIIFPKNPLDPVALNLFLLFL